ncbi:uncharacterized protein BX663DRAFT_518078 [Cokeromyces recurvatus]|uniref:uncharacterized protein n=1 Tax=Cokeromyces recurvatus TaxID=90255 RepID=UPI00221F5320|nr:uncharacterized protein BX663DRAFT_518078 [Cokeromyces recurvatus]KAI7900267.1 hypothetical protein BX663DRAFT_518078 [Cokeromyces recurvatus]
MLQHPLESLDNTTTCQESRDDSLDSFSPFIVDDDDDVDLSSFEKRVSPPPPAIHNNDNIVRAQSPFGRRYLKPINGIQIKGFARSAQRRSSVLTLGSIERLQNFYAKKELKVNKIGTLGFQQETFVEEPDSIEDQLPTPQEPPPSWIDLNVETDLDILLSLCFKDIQTTLTIITLTEPLDTTLHPDTSFQILPFLQAVTTMLSSVKKYTVNRQDLSNEAINKLRYASLHLLEIIKELETNYRLKEEEEEEEKGDTKGFLYRASDFNRLGKERQAIHDYLNVIEKYAFNPPHHIGSPPALFTPEIETLIEKMGILSLTKEEEIKTFNNIPEWLERGSFVNNPIGKVLNMYVYIYVCIF